MSTYIPPKDPAAVLDYEFDWSAWLAEGETFVGQPEVTVDAGLTLNPDGKVTTAADGKVTFWLGGGTPRTTYTVACRVTTSQGRTDERSFRFAVNNR